MSYNLRCMLLKDRDCLVFSHETLLMLVDLLDRVDCIGKQHLKLVHLNVFVNFYFLALLNGSRKKKKKNLEKSQNKHKAESVYILVINIYIEINIEKITDSFYS